jgi:fatty acid desaturase
MFDFQDPARIEQQIGGRYEFTEVHANEFLQLSRWMNLDGVIHLVLAGLALLTAFIGNLAGALVGIILLAVGAWIITAANFFRKIAESEGSDIRHLMGGVQQLRKLFMLQALLFLVAIAVQVIAGILVGVAR